MKKEQKTEQQPNSNSAVDNSQVSPTCLKPIVGSSVFKPYWIICVNSYEYDGKEISKGSMHLHYSMRPVMSKNWRRATGDEVVTKNWFKGNWFNLKNV